MNLVEYYTTTNLYLTDKHALSISPTYCLLCLKYARRTPSFLDMHTSPRL